MKIEQRDDWQFSVDVFQTASGPVARVTDGRMTLVGGDDAKGSMQELATLLVEAAGKLKSEADGNKPS